jgi:hypothetical protein
MALKILKLLENLEKREELMNDHVMLKKKIENQFF